MGDPDICRNHKLTGEPFKNFKCFASSPSRLHWRRDREKEVVVVCPVAFKCLVEVTYPSSESFRDLLSLL